MLIIEPKKEFEDVMRLEDWLEAEGK